MDDGEVSNKHNSYKAFVGPGEIVGEMALIFGQRGEETMKAVKPTTCLVLDRTKFAMILNNFPKEREVIMAMAEWRLQQAGIDRGLLVSRVADRRID
jgi:CRP-like cAMP-binding protein